MSTKQSQLMITRNVLNGSSVTLPNEGLTDALDIMTCQILTPDAIIIEGLRLFGRHGEGGETLRSQSDQAGQEHQPDVWMTILPTLSKSISSVDPPGRRNKSSFARSLRSTNISAPKRNRERSWEQCLTPSTPPSPPENRPTC